MKVSFSALELDRKGTLVVMLAENGRFLASAERIDTQTSGLIQRAMAASHFTGNFGQTLEILAPADLPANRLLLLGLGKSAELTPAKAETLGALAYAAVAAHPETQISAAIDPMHEGPDAATLNFGAAAASPDDQVPAPFSSEDEGIDAVTFAAHFTQGVYLRAYRFDKYLTRQKPEEKFKIEKLQVMLADSGAAKRAYSSLASQAEAVFYARNLVSEPGNILNPETYADRLKSLEKHEIDVEVLTLKDLRKLGMGALLGVAQGSKAEARVVVMRWNGGKESAAPIALLGKGVTFDSGGLSLKPSKSMEDMKWDMAGSAVVAGAMLALARRKAKVNAVGIVGLVENMPSATAQRPGDIVTSMSGQTIEVLNTDAEGRLVLADLLWYAQDRFKPAAMIDLATLTGAIITALGNEHAGLFANKDALADAILAAGKATGETLWRMPLDDAYDEHLKSSIADMKNIGNGGAGSAVAAAFLQRFVKKVPWAHLDIAGVAWADKSKGVTPKGATGWGVRLLDQLIKSHYEA